MNKIKHSGLFSALFALPLLNAIPAQAQQVDEAGSGGFAQVDASGWNDDDAHPLRVAAYALHPVGWVAREFVFRPLSFFASSTEVTRTVMGHRHHGDWRRPSCFSKDSGIPDCRAHLPFDYEKAEETSLSPDVAEVFFPNVLFDLGQKDLTSEGRERVKQIASSLSPNRSVRVVLEGHTDDIGSDAFNLKLGLDRAKVVQSELEALGISAERLSSVSFGETRPLDSAKTAEARAKNRRVEVKVAKYFKRDNRPQKSKRRE